MYTIPHRKNLIFLDDNDIIPKGFIEVKARADVGEEPERWERAIMHTDLADTITSDGHWKAVPDVHQK